jgi:uncharacterized protein
MKQRIAPLLASALLALALFGVAAAGSLEDGGAAYARGDYAAAVRLLLPLAEHGNADAMLVLSDSYCNGTGQYKKISECWIWLRRSAERGNATAQLYVGWAYEFGEVTGGKNNWEAAKWFLLAADQDEPYASRGVRKALLDW